MDHYIEKVHNVYRLRFVTEPHVEVDVTSTVEGVRVRETLIFTFAEWNSAKSNGYYTKERATEGVSQ